MLSNLKVGDLVAVRKKKWGAQEQYTYTERKIDKVTPKRITVNGYLYSRESGKSIERGLGELIEISTELRLMFDEERRIAEERVLEAKRHREDEAIHWLAKTQDGFWTVHETDETYNLDGLDYVEYAGPYSGRIAAQAEADHRNLLT
jgi:hypothetical protein